MLGSGDVHLEMLLQLQKKHKGYAVGWVGFSVPVRVAHRITAASHIFAMASRGRAAL